MKKLFFKLLVLLAPLLVLAILFVWDDPMKIIHDTKDPVSPGVLMNDRLYQARYLQSTKTKYNSFIFGSSRSKAFKTSEWKKYIGNEAIPYHMGVNDETLFGIERKISFLQQQGFKLDHVLIQLDHRILSLPKDHEAHIFREYYLVSGETASSYYQRYVKAYLKPSFLKEYLSYKRSFEIKEVSEFLWDPGFSFSQKTGDIYYSRYDQEIKIDSLNYYKKLKLETYLRNALVKEPLISGQTKELLESIAKILRTEKSRYKVLISPNFDQISLHANDVKELKAIFGKVNVRDFSGVNEITKALGNYYEHKHFKPYVATWVLNKIYAK